MLIGLVKSFCMQMCLELPFENRHRAACSKHSMSSYHGGVCSEQSRNRCEQFLHTKLNKTLLQFVHLYKQLTLMTGL